MKFFLPPFIFLILLLGVGLPELTSAQGFLPCDGSVDNPCNSCDIVTVANEFISWLIGAVMVLFAVLMVVAGFGLVTSQGNPDALNTAKSKFINAIIGLIIVLSAWIMVDTLMRGLIGNNGQIEGYLAWSEVECTTQVESFTASSTVAIEFATTEDDTSIVLPSAGGNCPTGYTIDAFGSCAYQSGPVLPDAGGNCPAGYTFDAFGDCEFTGAANLTLNPGMDAIFDSADGGSSMVRDGAEEAMQALLAGPFTCLQQGFGRPIVINDGIARAGSSRETETQNSRHFFGDALDLSTRGMSNADQMRLYEQARQCGFSGFGFGTTILHGDLGASRAWAYGNQTYGGQSVCSLGVRC